MVFLTVLDFVVYQVSVPLQLRRGITVTRWISGVDPTQTDSGRTSPFYSCSENFDRRQDPELESTRQ